MLCSIVLNCLNAPFSKISPKQKQLALSLKSKTNRATTKIDSQRPPHNSCTINLHACTILNNSSQFLNNCRKAQFSKSNSQNLLNTDSRTLHKNYVNHPNTKIDSQKPTSASLSETGYPMHILHNGSQWICILCTIHCKFAKSSVQQKEPAKLPETKTVDIVKTAKRTVQTQKLTPETIAKTSRKAPPQNRKQK